MNPSTKVGVAVAGGYLLGRTKRARLAIALGSWLLGRKLDPKELGKEALQQLSQRPEVAKLTGDMRGELLNVGRAAAVAAMNSRIERLASSLDSRTSQLREQLELGSGVIDGEADDVEDDADDDAEDADDDGTDQDTDDEDVQDEEDERPSRDARRRSSDRPSRQDRQAPRGGDRPQRPAKASRSSSESRAAGRGSAPAKRPAHKSTARKKAGSSSSRRRSA